MSNLKELLKRYNLKVNYLPIEGKGFLIRTPSNKPDEIFINDALSDEEAKQVVLHEIGHLKNDDCTMSDYKDSYLARVHSENEANSYMVKHKIKEYFDLGNDIPTSNYVTLAESLGITDYMKVKNELSKYLLN